MSERARRFAPTVCFVTMRHGLEILFIMRHSGFVRNFESTLRMLCERGHRVHVAFLNDDRHWLVDTTNVAQQLCNELPASRGTAPVRDDAWGVLGRELRGTLDYLRYLAPRYRDAPKLRSTRRRGCSRQFLRMTQRGLFGTRPGLAVFAAWYRLLERSIPVSGEIDAFVAEQQPDLLLISPSIEPGSPQREYVRAAAARQIRTVLCVGSWDNLTNKGLIHGRFDLVTVWNDHMKKEAVELHGVRSGSGGGDRRAAVRSLVHVAAFHIPRSVLRTCRPRRDSASTCFICALRSLLRLTKRGSFTSGSDSPPVVIAAGCVVRADLSARIRRMRSSGLGLMRAISRTVRSIRGVAPSRSMRRARPTTSIRSITALRSSGSTPRQRSKARS